MSRFLTVCCLFLCFSYCHCSANKGIYTQQKIIMIIATPSGSVIIGKDTLSSEALAKELQNRLWKSYLGTGKMQNSIQLTFSGEVLMGTRGAVMDAILEGQQLALKDVCLDRHKTLFENLNESQKTRIKKMFPILFQTSY